MARSRQIKPDFFLNEELASLAPLVRLFFIGLWLLADREGRLEDRPTRIKAQIFPYEDLDAEAVMGSLDRRFIARYEVEGARYIEILKFKKHQHIHPDEKKSVIPAFPGFPGDSPGLPGIMPCSSSSSSSPSFSSSPSLNGGHAKQQSRVQTPKIEDVKAYCAERKNKVDAQQWFDHYTSNGWRVGRNPMKDWKAAVRTWEKNDYGQNVQRDGKRGRIVGGAGAVPGKYDHLG